MVVIVIVVIVTVAVIVVVVVYANMLSNCSSGRDGTLVFCSETTIKCPQMFLNITFALALADRQGQGPQIILAVRGMIIILV